MDNVYEIIERLCNNKNITDEELRLVEEYLETCDGLIERLGEWNEDRKMLGIDLRELSGDGFARDDVLAIGPEKWLDLRGKLIADWKGDLAKIKSKIKEIKK